MSVLVSVGFAFHCVSLRSAAEMESHGRPVNIGDLRVCAEVCGVLLSGFATINSAASYQLDHAPTLPLITRTF